MAVGRDSKSKWDKVKEMANPVPGDIPKALAELGIQIASVDGDEVYAYCPAHPHLLGKADRTGKHWSVNAETGIHNCFACGFGGPFWFVVRMVRDDFDDDAAIEWSKRRESHEKTMRLLLGGHTAYTADEVPEVRESDLALYVEVPDNVCADRNLDPGSVDHFGILWDPKTERWITPVRKPYSNTLMGWQEKGHRDRFFKNQPKGMEKSLTLFGVNEIQSSTGVLVESPLDCPRVLSVLGDRCCVLSTFGSKISHEQLDLLPELGIRTLISAYDNDKAGDLGNEKILEHLSRQVRLKFWDYGRATGKDPGDQTDKEIRFSFDNAYGRKDWVSTWD